MNTIALEPNRLTRIDDELKTIMTPCKRTHCNSHKFIDFCATVEEYWHLTSRDRVLETLCHDFLIILIKGKHSEVRCCLWHLRKLLWLLVHIVEIKHFQTSKPLTNLKDTCEEAALCSAQICIASTFLPRPLLSHSPPIVVSPPLSVSILPRCLIVSPPSSKYALPCQCTLIGDKRATWMRCLLLL